ncbi:MAG: GNAT family N-acetyltransferase [Microlunatus sp.]|nr:GNAT family N-acetyltransferase [Microlunatus sp.]
MQQPAIVQLGDLRHLDDIIAYDHLARSGDVGRIAEVREAAESGRLRIAVRDRQVLGHAIVRQQVFFGSDFLDLVFVAESARRTGIGLLLVRAVRDQAHGRIWTSTNLSNAPMHRLLRTNGWHPAGMLDGLDEADPEVFYFSDGTAATE